MFKSLESAAAGTAVDTDAALAALPFDQNGLTAAVAQQFDTVEVLMLAWMNRAAIEETQATGRACYWYADRSSCFYNRIDTQHLVVLSNPPPRHGDTS